MPTSNLRHFAGNCSGRILTRPGVVLALTVLGATAGFVAGKWWLARSENALLFCGLFILSDALWYLLMLACITLGILFSLLIGAISLSILAARKTARQTTIARQLILADRASAAKNRK